MSNYQLFKRGEKEMKSNTTELEQTKVMDVLRQEPGFMTIKEIVEKAGNSDMNAKRIGKWLSAESDTLGVRVTKKYGLNRYKFGEVKGVSISEPSVLHEVFTEIRNAGVDVESIITRIKDRKMKELETLKSL